MRRLPENGILASPAVAAGPRPTATCRTDRRLIESENYLEHDASGRITGRHVRLVASGAGCRSGNAATATSLATTALSRATRPKCFCLRDISFTSFPELYFTRDGHLVRAQVDGVAQLDWEEIKK